MFTHDGRLQSQHRKRLCQELQSPEQVEIVKNTRTVTKLDMKFNNATRRWRLIRRLLLLWPLGRL
ncbi:hypothetical protein BJX99DRAFT_242613 [Aspergillus californicus]